MKKTLTYSAVFITIIFAGLIIVDLFVLRGYATTQLLPNDWLSDEPIQLDVTYEIKLNDNSEWSLTFANNSLHFLSVLTYRNNELVVAISDSNFFLVASYSRISIADTVLEEVGNSYFCGTGLGLVLIRPFETFTLQVKDIYFMVSPEIAFYIPHYKLDDRMGAKDQVEYQAFLPVRTIGSSKWQNIYSNKFLLSYRRIKTHLAQDAWLKEVMETKY